MVAVISRRYGLEYIENAEDIVSETFLQAAESWGIKGIPPNPVAWLYAVAKQKTLYYFRRKKIFEQKVVPGFKDNVDEKMEELDFNFQNIKDSQLQMIFAVCNPLIASEAQIGLALRILCGFGIDELAEAFYTNKETINKRLYRAKDKLRTEGIIMQLPPANEIPGRLENVLRVIYLMFNEGYYSGTNNKMLQKDFCLEAMRLCLLLTEYEITDLPEANALLALMCFHSSRFDARLTDDESVILYEEQKEELWDNELINRGKYFLGRSLRGNVLSSYHIEAKIAYWHCTKEDSKEKWEDILGLYESLLEVNFSPSVALNRLYALYKVKGPEIALKETIELKLEDNLYYFILLGELYKVIDREKSRENLMRAYSIAKTNSEKEIIKRKIDNL